MNISRNNYIDEINKYKDINLIKVITGMRRCGKSTIFELFIEQLIKDGIENKQIQHYNFESPLTYRELGDSWREIFFSIMDKTSKNKTNYIFLDEIQQIEDFEKLIDGLFVEKNIDLYVTGSNAYLLSSELATLLTGRNIEIHVLPYSFKEYRSALNLDLSNQELFFSNYFLASALPLGVTLKPQGNNVVLNYVNEVYESILENDIYPRIKEANHRVFENVFKYVIANIGSPVSPSGIAKALKQDGINIHNETVSDYLDKLCDSYLLYRTHRFDIKGKRQLATQEKYYLPDLAIRYLLVGREDFSDRGHLLENIVYLELVRRGGQIWVGKLDENEIDFVVKDDNGIIQYYQVSFSLADEKTFEREIRPLQKLNDNYSKTIITADLLEGNQNGINIINIVNWLLEN